MKIRIAIVCPYYPWPPSFGGVETIVRSVSTEFAKRGHEVYVITTPFDVTTMKQVAEYGVEERDGVTIYNLKPGKLKLGYARLLKNLRKVIKEIEPDIIHEHNLHPHLIQLALWRGSIKYRLIAELHHPAVNPDFLMQKLAMPFAVLALKLISKDVDVFIAHTLIEKDWLRSKGIPDEKISLIRFPAIPERLLSIDIQTEMLGDVLYLGRIVPKKGVHILIKALKILKQLLGNFKVTIAGPAELGYLEELKNLVERFNLKNNIIFLGMIKEEEKYTLIKSHKVLVLPSLKEYTGGVLLEAQALGVPVIATKVGAVPEMLIENETGLLVKPNNEFELAKAIETLLSDSMMYQSFSRKAREFAKNFTVEKAVENLGKVYYNVL
jgi:glycosyltransferase involved in cell wall biosynthesis